MKTVNLTDGEIEIILNQIKCLQTATKREKGQWLPWFVRRVNSIVRKLED